MKKEATPILSAEDILAQMRAGVQTVREIRLRDAHIPLRIISIDEINMVRREALKDQFLQKGDETDKNLAIQRYSLKLASDINKNGTPTLSDKLLSIMSVDEINHLYNEYIKFMDDANPSIESIEPEKFQLLVEAVKKNIITSKECSLLQLKAIFSAFQDMIQKQDTQT
jgi:hypothetical protein